MKKFTFIFMLYNLNENGLSGTEGEHTDEINEQITSVMDSELDKDINMVTVKHIPEKTEGPVIRSYTNTLLSVIKPGTEPGKNREELLFNFGARNVGDADSLAGIFVLIQTVFNAEKFVIFTYDHSNFIGHLTTRLLRGGNFIKIAFNKNIDIKGLDNIFNNLHTPANDEKKEIAEKTTNEFKAVFENGGQVEFTKLQDFDMLTNDELAKAIFRAFVLNPVNRAETTSRVEAVFFNTCYTGCLDNLYLYAGRVNYLIASEGETYFNSFNIANVISYFLQNNVDKAVRLCVQNFENDFRLINPGAKEISKMILCAFNLQSDTHGKTFRQEFSDTFNQLLTSFIVELPEVFKVVRSNAETAHWPDCYFVFNDEAPTSVGKIANETFTYCFDFFHFFRTLAGAPELHNFSNKIVQLIELISSRKIAFFRGEQVRNTFEGLSLFFPFDIDLIGEKKKNQIAHSYSFYSPFKNEFAQETYWPEFIQLFQKKLP